MSEEIVVKDYIGRLYSKYISIGGYDYDHKQFPDELTLVGEAIDDETEQRLISLMNEGKAEEMKKIMNCMARELEGSIAPLKLTDLKYYKHKAGEGMNWEREDRKYSSGYVITINLGSDALMVFSKGPKKYEIMLPRKSMFLLKDEKLS